MSSDYPRDMVGYGAKAPVVQWPGSARLALQIVLNYEEGAEQCVLHGDGASEAFLSDIVGAVPYAGVRHKSMESLYEYGSRAGVWRLLRMFAERRIQVTVFGVGMALQRNPSVVAAMLEADHEIASHGWRWIDYQFVDEDTEREHMRLAVEAIEGTDATILRGGKLGKGKAVAIKVCKPEQDHRFDIPAIGLETIQTMRQAGIRALAVEAGKAIVFDRPSMIKLADEYKMTIIAIEDQAPSEQKSGTG